MATHSRILAWKVPWTEKPGRYSAWGDRDLDMTEQLSTYAESPEDKGTCRTLTLPCSVESEKAVAPHSSALAWKIHAQRSLVGCSPWGREESDVSERLQFHFSLSCIGEGNGNPLQCSCLENPRDGGAWWASIYGVTRSRT